MTEPSTSASTTSSGATSSAPAASATTSAAARYRPSEGEIMDLFSTSFSLPGRIYLEEALLRREVALRFPEKTLPTILAEVFEAFIAATQLKQDRLKPLNLSFSLLSDEFANGTESKRKWKRTFTYGERMWCGSVEHRITEFAERLVYFVNIKLPNDGFFYTAQFGGRFVPERTPLAVSDRYNRELMRRVITNLAALFKFPGNITIETFYLVHRQTLEIRFWNVDQTKCVKVAFENGFHEHANRSKGDAEDATAAFNDLLNAWADKDSNN